MKIILNNRDESFELEQMNILQLLEQKNFSFKMLVIKVNGKLIRKTEYESTMVKEGDEVMVLHLISGG
jgi:thiamine biosynthesis protein ThiS